MRITAKLERGGCCTENNRLVVGQYNLDKEGKVRSVRSTLSTSNIPFALGLVARCVCSDTMAGG